MRRAALVLMAGLGLAALNAPPLAAVTDDAVEEACEGLGVDGSSFVSTIDLRAAASEFTESQIKGAKKLGRDLTRTAPGSAERAAALRRARAWCDDHSFAPAPPLPPSVVISQQFDGTGDRSVTLDSGTNSPALLRVTAGGTGPFQVRSFDATGRALATIIDRVAPYSGTRAVNLETGPTVARLDIEAADSWAIDVVPLSEAPRVAAPGHYDGTGDEVLIVQGTPTTARFEALATGGRFVVVGYGTIGTSLIDVETPYSGSVIMPTEARLLLDVSARVDWTLDLR